MATNVSKAMEVDSAQADELVRRGIISGIVPAQGRVTPSFEQARQLKPVVSSPSSEPSVPLGATIGALAVVLVVTFVESLLGLGFQALGSFSLASLNSLLVVAAILKVGLIAGVFMRLIWDRGIHTIFVAITLAFYAVFLIACVGDRREYEWASTSSVSLDY